MKKSQLNYLVYLIVIFFNLRTFGLEIKATEINEMQTLQSILFLPQAEKEKRWVTNLNDEKSVHHFCTETGATVFLQESNLKNLTPDIWSQNKIPSYLWRSTTFLSYLQAFDQESLVSEVDGLDTSKKIASYFSIRHQSIFENLTRLDLQKKRTIIANSISRLNSARGPGNYFKTELSRALDSELTSKKESLIKSALLKSVAENLCSELTAEVNSCGQAVAWMYEVLSPTTNQISFHRLWKLLLTDSKTVETYKRLAIKLLNRIKDKEIKQANFFDDIKTEFRQSQYSEQQAEELTWSTIALLSSGGGNTYRRLINLGVSNPVLEEILFILSNAPIVLDSIPTTSDTLYSYPPQISNSCDTGKSYHFWSAAYFSKMLIMNKYDFNVSIAAALTFQKIYQFGFGDGGRDTSLPFKISQFDNYNNRIRQDLMLVTLGAKYGADPKFSLGAQKFDQLFRVSFKKSEKIEQNPNEQPVSVMSPLRAYDQYKRWFRLFAPNSTLEMINSK